MLVNSDFKGFFNNCWITRSRIATVMLVLFVTASSFTKHSDRDNLRAKQVNLIIRQIGHRLLLQSGDSTSRVLPVTEIKEGTFLLQFENEFVFNHDSLMALSRGSLPKTKFPYGYTVIVQECTKADIVYGFQVNNTSYDIPACRGRRQPPGCYTIEFAFPNLYEEAEQKNVGYQNTEQKKADAKNAEQKKAAINQPTEEFESLKVDVQKGNPKFEDLKTTISNYPSIKWVYGGILVLLTASFLIGRFGKNQTVSPIQNQNHAILKKPIPDSAALGKFLFDVKGQCLRLGSEVISLTDKECKILELLTKNFGELIPRETLMQKVWIDEGVITGRSLDMFVSKLRKKLSGDPELRITNVHGKGYKLEISV